MITRLHIDTGHTGESATDKASVADDATTQERALVYRWLAAQFAREPSVETLSIYRSHDGQMLLNGMAEIPAFVAVVDDIRALVDDASQADLEVIAMDLAAAYAGLFLGARGRRSAPPYRSFYINPDGRLMQQPAALMQSTLEGLDIRLSDQFPEPPDHIAAQLEVMAKLVETASPMEQAQYLDSQLLDWVGVFNERCQTVMADGFYAKVTSALASFVFFDRDWLDG